MKNGAHLPLSPNATHATQDYLPIGDYAMVGDAQSGALIARDGNVDWLCLPHFDSPAVLCRILDAKRGGFLAFEPDFAVGTSTRSYRPSSNVLETQLLGDDRAITITDAMPFATGDPTPPLDGVWKGQGRNRLVRLIQVKGGTASISLVARIGFDFGLVAPTIELVPGKGAVLSNGGSEFIALVWPGNLEIGDGDSLRGTLELGDGDEAACAIGYAVSRAAALTTLAETDWSAQVEAADAAWLAWARGFHIDGPFSSEILRSALTLKMLTFEPTGAVIASPTTSLPEAIGGTRNWDYRYCWIRDATFTLYALILVGDTTAAAAFWRWIENTCVRGGASNLQVMYGVHGERDLPEKILDHLSGYRDSRPVRVGNEAAKQRQTDIYGELLDAYWFYIEHLHKDGPPDIDSELWGLFRDIADYICEIWRKPDQGLWEVRSGPRHFVYSKVMCWVGLDRALRLARLTGLDCDRDRWASERDAIMAEVLDLGFDQRLNSFTMAYDGIEMDAALLRLPLVGFLPPEDPRIVGTIERVQSELQIGGLVRRYIAEDGLPGTEGAFSICSFWLVDCLVAIGRIDEAETLFRRMLGYANDVGLFAEEVEPQSGAALGNFPQGFTHLALIDAGVDLTEALRRRAPVQGDTASRARQVAGTTHGTESREPS